MEPQIVWEIPHMFDNLLVTAFIQYSVAEAAQSSSGSYGSVEFAVETQIDSNQLSVYYHGYLAALVACHIDMDVPKFTCQNSRANFHT